MRKGPSLEVKGGEEDPAKAAKEEGLVKLAETHGESCLLAPRKETRKSYSSMMLHSITLEF